MVESYGTVALFVYIVIAFSQIRLRRHLERVAPERLKVRMWCFPYLSYFAIIGMLSIFAAMAFIPSLQKRSGSVSQVQASCSVSSLFVIT